MLDASFAYGQSDGHLERTVNVAGGGATTGKTQGMYRPGRRGGSLPDRSRFARDPSLRLIHANVKQDGLTESSLNGL